MRAEDQGEAKREQAIDQAENQSIRHLLCKHQCLSEAPGELRLDPETQRETLENDPPVRTASAPVIGCPGRM
jgi:hypothetical protein